VSKKNSIAQLQNIIEASLFAASHPLSIDHLVGLFSKDEQPARDTVRKILDKLIKHYRGRGIELVEVASGFRFQVHQSCAQQVGMLWEEKPARYSRAMLETLSLIAYRQPITRGEIEEVRGVAVSTTIMKTLLERGWVRSIGHRDVPGRPALYATTRSFLDYFNLKSLDELPTLGEVKNLDLDEITLDSTLSADVPSAIAH
jgi:segregation and condensation protein B